MPVSLATGRHGNWQLGAKGQGARQVHHLPKTIRCLKRFAPGVNPARAARQGGGNAAARGGTRMGCPRCRALQRSWGIPSAELGWGWAAALLCLSFPLLKTKVWVSVPSLPCSPGQGKAFCHLPCLEGPRKTCPS